MRIQVIITTLSLALGAGCATQSASKAKRIQRVTPPADWWDQNEYEMLTAGFNIPVPDPANWQGVEKNDDGRKWQPRLGGLAYVQVKLHRAGGSQTLETTAEYYKQKLLSEFSGAKVTKEVRTRIGTAEAIDVHAEINTTFGDTVKIRETYAIRGGKTVVMRQAGLHWYYLMSHQTFEGIRVGFRLPPKTIKRKSVNPLIAYR